MKAWEILRAKASGQVDLDEIGVTPEARRAFNQAMGEYILRDAHGLWLEPETGDGHCDPDQLVVTIGTRISALYDLFNNEKGSPIEGMMGAAMLWLDMDWAGMPSLDYLNGPKDHLEQFGSSDGLDYFITPQARIGAYRADFLVWFVMGKHYAGVIVECDGHDFHERTKEQAARDKKRDRELLAAGYPVMRFTGSEIFKDVTGCVEQLRGPLSDALERVSRAGGLFK